MSSEEFYSSTLREVDMYLEASRWRQQNTARFLRYAAWHSALYQRIDAKRFPDLKTVMAFPREKLRAQTPEEMEAAIRLWQVVLEKKFGKAQPQAEV